MRRLMAFVVTPAFLILLSILVLVLLGLVVNELKRGQPAIVHLKEVVADGDTREVLSHVSCDKQFAMGAVVRPAIGHHGARRR